MTITWRAATGLEAQEPGPGLSALFTLPAGHSEDDLLIANYGHKFASASNNNVPAAPDGWDTSASARTTATNRAVRAVAYTRVHDGSESAPSVTEPGTPIAQFWSAMAAYSSSGYSNWVVQSTAGIDDTITGTDVSVTGDALSWEVGDQIMVLSAGPDDTSLETDVGLSFTGGVAAGSLTQHLSTVSTSLGSDATMYCYTATITAAGTGAPTFVCSTADNYANRSVVFLLIREPNAAAASATVTPSRISLTVDLVELTAYMSSVLTPENVPATTSFSLAMVSGTGQQSVSASIYPPTIKLSPNTVGDPVPLTGQIWPRGR